MSFDHYLNHYMRLIMKKFLLFLSVLILAASFFVFYVSSKHRPAHSNHSLKIGLNPWIGTGLFYIAQDKGFFNAEKVHDKLVKYDDGAVGKELLSSGHIDMLA